jgi:hypothetical protein
MTDEVRYRYAKHTRKELSAGIWGWGDGYEKTSEVFETSEV